MEKLLASMKFHNSYFEESSTVLLHLI